MKKKKLKKFVNEELDNYMSEFFDEPEQGTAPIVDPVVDDSDDSNLDSLRGASIEVTGEGSRMSGKIVQVKETKNGIVILYKTKWNDIEQLDLYFDEFDELRANKTVGTLNGQVTIK